MNVPQQIAQQLKLREFGRGRVVTAVGHRLHCSVDGAESEDSDTNSLNRPVELSNLELPALREAEFHSQAEETATSNPLPGQW